MKKSLLITLILFTAALPAFGQNENAEQVEVRPAQAVERTERKPGFFDRLFKRRKGDAREAPARTDQNEAGASSTPPIKKAIPTEASEIEETPRPLKRRKRQPAPTPTPLPEQEEVTDQESELSPSKRNEPKSKDLARKAPTPASAPELASGPESTPESTPRPENAPDSSQLRQPIPFVATPQPEGASASPVPDLLDPNYVNRMNERYKKVRSEALADEKVSALKDEADVVFERSKRAKALKVYYEALFQKMREIDPSLKTRIDSRENATMRRIDSLTPVGE